MTTVASSGERAALAETVRRCLERHPGPRGFLADEHGPARTDPELWRVLTQQVGLTSLVVPEDCDGAGGSYADLSVAVEALGGALAPVPALCTAGMATAVLLGGDVAPARDELLARIAAGEAVVTVVWHDVSGPLPDQEPPLIRAQQRAGGHRLSGTSSFVLNGTYADVLLVPARSDDGVAVYAVEATATGLVRRSMTTLDLTRDVAEVAFDDVEGVVVCTAAASQDALGVGYDLTLAVLAAEQVGLAQRCLDETVAYVKDRVQFDRPIGSFQAVKHSLVEQLLQVEMARSARDEAVAAADAHLAAPTPQTATALRASASLAKSVCSEAATGVSRQCLHLMGGIGFTWEHDAHLRYRRALTCEHFLGDPSQHRVRLAAAVGV